MLSKIKNKENIITLFPKSPNEIEKLAKKHIAQTQEKIDKIINLENKDRTYQNTVKPLDELSSTDDISIFFSCLSALEMLNPDKEIRDAAHKALLTLQKFWIEKVSNDIKLYKAFKEYAKKNINNPNLSEEEKYFITESLQDYKRAGLDLPEDQRKKITEISKNLGELELAFETNIAADQSSIIVEEKDLEGLDPEFIQNLQKTDDDKLILHTNMPTYVAIMDNCKIEETRKKLYLAFNNRAYPTNEEILKKIIKKRDELAKRLGFASYAHLDIDNQMAKTPEIAKEFLMTLYKKASKKTQEEFKKLSANKINAWDLRYIKNQYKKKHFDIDEQKIAEYFPAEKTIKKLLNIYEEFLSLKFEVSEIQNLWHKDTKLVTVYKKNDNTLLGYLILDLHPRANKYSHACQMTIVPSVKEEGPSVCIVVANFPKSTENKPSLLQLKDVETFFHELGHALHAILGRTAVGSFAGTNVPTDFVEIPSQMLEEWLSDKNILKKISGHYKTNEPLEDKIIENILKLKHFDSGDFLQRQCYLSLLALEYFDAGADKNPKELRTNLLNKMRPNIVYDPQDNMQASFGHLSGYGAKYYSYMWSKVYAIDMFSKIKEHGLLNPKIGQLYIDKVIGKGASQDPNLLIKDFLEREPNQKAFLENMGIK